jgi:hypothetical protein
MLKPSGGDSKWKERVGLDKQLKSFVYMSWTIHLQSSIRPFTFTSCPGVLRSYTDNSTYVYNPIDNGP